MTRSESAPPAAGELSLEEKASLTSGDSTDRKSVV